MKELEMHDKMRIVQELVPGRQITLLHVIANPDPILYQKLGLAVVELFTPQRLCQGGLARRHATH